MLKFVVVFAACAVALVAAEPKTIFLPPDAEDITLVGNGFTVTVNQQHQKMQQQWKQVADESAEVQEPRKPANEDEDKAISNDKLFEETQAAQGDKTYGFLEADLLDWIDARVTQLAEKVERYEGEAFDGKLSDGNRIVINVLLLNTLTDLRNLVKENIPKMKWVKNKLRRVGKYRDPMTSFVEHFVQERIKSNLDIERKKKGTNKPGEDWQRNVQAIRRILNEQRYSDSVSKIIIDYLSGSFNMMERSRIYQDINKSSKRLDDGLIYKPAKGYVPAHFPFFSQDAIANGQ